MKKELIIDVVNKNVTIALVADNGLTELHKESLEPSFSVGNIYLGKVKKIMKGLNAAFIDIGYEKEAFIHYHDLGEHFPTFNNFIKQVLADRKKTEGYKVKTLPALPKEGNISDVLSTGQDIVVQITKEPISSKGPRLTTEISIAGRNIIILPQQNRISVSTKIKAIEERDRLKKLTQSITPPNFGVIVRTVAEGKRVAELDNELKIVLDRWNNVLINLRKGKDKLLHEESNRAINIIRDIFNPDFESIQVNNQTLFEEIKEYIQLIAPEKNNIVKLYKEELPIFDSCGITKQIKALFGRFVAFKRGAYLVVEHTEAMHVIDVNSGTRLQANQSEEEHALEVNLLAATEIARQLKLRDMGGIIVVDFIDLDEEKNRQKLYDHIRRAMESDRAKHNILPLSKIGVMQITRQRVRPQVTINTEETCPTCLGKGKIQPSILLTEEIEEKVSKLVKQFKIKKFSLYVHPYLYAYMNQGLISMIAKWKVAYGFGIKFIPSQNLGLLQYKFFDQENNEINLQELEPVIR